MAAVELGQHGDFRLSHDLQQHFPRGSAGAAVVELLVLAQNQPANAVKYPGQLQMGKTAFHRGGVLQRIFDKENIDLALLLAKLSTMAVLKLVKKNDGLNSKVFQIFKKNKEQIFHQVVLFIRELFQSFLTVASIDPFLITDNILDLANPYFTYDKGLVIPVSADAFSSEQLKDMLKDIIFDLNDKFLDRDIDHIIVIYLLRGYVVRLNIK